MLQWKGEVKEDILEKKTVVTCKQTEKSMVGSIR
jgi:hypothetical protein